MAEGLQRCPSSMATLPQLEQTYFIAASLSLHIWEGFTLGAPQKLHLLASPQGLHKCPGSSATAPQFLQVYAITLLLSLARPFPFRPNAAIYFYLNNYDIRKVKEALPLTFQFTHHSSHLHQWIALLARACIRPCPAGICRCDWHRES
jgi:hypothetical protein